MSIESLNVHFTNRQPYTNHLTCSICCNIFKMPVMTACLHVFCRSCITLLLLNSNRCPTCRLVISKDGLQVHEVAKEIIDSLDVLCSYQGCAWIGKYFELSQHLEACELKGGLPTGLKKQESEYFESMASLEETNCINLNTKVSLKERLYLKKMRKDNHIILANSTPVEGQINKKLENKEEHSSILDNPDKFSELKKDKNKANWYIEESLTIRKMKPTDPNKEVRDSITANGNDPYVLTDDDLVNFLC